MKDVQDKLQLITEEIEDLVGAVAFGQSKLREFFDIVALLDTDISSITHYRHYQLCSNEHRKVMSMLTTTSEALAGWRVLALTYLDELNTLPFQSGKTSLNKLKQAKHQCEGFFESLSLHKQQMDKMHAQMTQLAHRLMQKKRKLSAHEVSLLE